MRYPCSGWANGLGRVTGGVNVGVTRWVIVVFDQAVIAALFQKPVLW